MPETLERKVVLDGDTKNKDLPSISFIMPTLNAERHIYRCLKSIKRQKYPLEKIEILIVDGGSNDETTEIARKMGCSVLKNEKVIAEYGKAVGIKKSKGDYFILLDADNEIVEDDWLQKMTRPMIESPDIFGVESPLSFDKKLSSLNRYFARMRIADPLAKSLVDKPKKIVRKNGYKILYFNRNTALITGANGFLWNKKLINEVGGWDEKFEEANYSTYISNKTGFGYAIPEGASVRHYYCDNLKEFLTKRKKIALKIRGRLEKKESVWVDNVSATKKVFSALYLASFIGPLGESIWRSAKDKTLDWFWHPISSFLTVFIFSYYFLKN